MPSLSIAIAATLTGGAVSIFGSYFVLAGKSQKTWHFVVWVMGWALWVSGMFFGFMCKDLLPLK